VRARQCWITEDLTPAEQQLKKKLKPGRKRLYNEQGIAAVATYQVLLRLSLVRSIRPADILYSSSRHADACPHATRPALLPVSSRVAHRSQEPKLWWQQPDLQPRRGQSLWQGVSR